MKYKNIIIFTSPLQLINAIEYVHYKKLDINEVDFISYQPLNSYKSNFTILDNLSNLYNLNIHHFRINSRFKLIYEFKKFFLLNRLIKKYASFQIPYLIIGEFRSVFMLSLLKLNPLKTVVVDDGNVAIDLINSYRNDHNFNFKLRSNAVYNLIYLKFYNFYFGINKYKKLINFYTAYFEDSSITTKNNYNFIKSKTSNLKILGEAYVIGSKYSEYNILDFDSEIKFYYSLVDKLKNITDSKIVYVAHRDDSSRKLRELGNIFCEIKRFDLPIELVPIIKNEMPVMYISSFSSSLFTIKSLYNSRANIYYSKLPKKEINKSFYDEIYEIYSKLDDFNIHEIQ